MSATVNENVDPKRTIRIKGVGFAGSSASSNLYVSVVRPGKRRFGFSARFVFFGGEGVEIEPANGSSKVILKGGAK